MDRKTLTTLPAGFKIPKGFYLPATSDLYFWPRNPAIIHLPEQVDNPGKKAGLAAKIIGHGKLLFLEDVFEGDRLEIYLDPLELQQLAIKEAAENPGPVSMYNSTAYRLWSHGTSSYSSENLLAEFARISTDYQAGKIAEYCQEIGLPNPQKVADGVFEVLSGEYQRCFVHDFAMKVGKERLEADEEISSLKKELVLREEELKTLQIEISKLTDTLRARQSALIRNIKEEGRTKVAEILSIVKDQGRT